MKYKATALNSENKPFWKTIYVHYPVLKWLNILWNTTCFFVKITGGLSYVCSFKKTKSFLLLFKIILKKCILKQMRHSGREGKRRGTFTPLSDVGWPSPHFFLIKGYREGWKSVWSKDYKQQFWQAKLPPEWGSRGFTGEQNCLFRCMRSFVLCGKRNSNFLLASIP